MTTRPSLPLRYFFRDMLAARYCRLLLLAVWALVVLASMGIRIMQIQTNHLALLREGARNVALTILAVRTWNSSTDGIYTPISPGLLPNPFLHHPKREVFTIDGQTLTLVNPAYMTRLVSQILGKTTSIQISLRSLRPLNPANRADPWEAEALRHFENGEEEIFEELVQADGGAVFRYMLPVKTEESCLSCHAAQGDRLGAVRGGLSIALPSARDGVRTEILFVILRHLGIFAILGAVCYALLGLLGRQWEAEQQRIEKNRLSEKMAALERLVRQFSEELRIPLEESIRLTAQNTDDIANLGRRLEQDVDSASTVLPALPQLQDRTGEALAGLQELMHRLNSLRHASFNLGEEAQRLNLAMLITDTLQTHASIYRHCAQIEVICTPDTEIICIPGLFDKILCTLLSNSVEHGFLKGSRHGHIRIETSQIPDGALLISYADNGVGMPPDRLACIFDPFPEPTGPDHKQGLSLYICYSLITFRMGGSIRCDSLVDGGTHFLITLPNALGPASDLRQ